MLLKAMDSYQLQIAQHITNVKGQYTSRKIKNYFRASELGTVFSGKRKLIYTFFAHQLPQDSKSAKNLRQLQNGDYVHERYQTAWQQMGIVVTRNGKPSMEQFVTSRKDPYLKQFEWEITGHYDGELDLNIIRAYAIGKAGINSVYKPGKHASGVVYELDKNGNRVKKPITGHTKGEWVVEPYLDFDYGLSIGYFTEDGNLNPNYKPLSMVADIKTMNPFSFKQLQDGSTEPISGYLNQIMFYMYMLNTPYGCLYVENKANNDIMEVQLVWKDLRGGQYDFSEELHGKEEPHIMRLYLSNDMFHHLITEINRTWETIKKLMKAQKENDYKTILKEMPPRCSDDPTRFPCSWNGGGKCEFYSHCWNSQHEGYALDIKAISEACAALEESPKLQRDLLGDVAVEYRTNEGERAFECVECGKEVIFKRIVGISKKCPHCGHSNVVQQMQE